MVVKVGGSILGEGIDSSTLEDIQRVVERDKLIIVHGGGKEVTGIAQKMGKDQKFIVSPSGVRSRYTDRETASIYTMVMSGKINKEIVASLQKIGLNAIGLSGVDAGILQGYRKKKLIVAGENNRKRIIDGGYTGKIHDVNTEPITLLLERGYLPIISPVALSEEYEFLNVDGDRAAAYVAGGVKADNALFLTDVPGILNDNDLIRDLSLRDAKELLPKMGFGMEKKLMASIEALELGVNKSIISSGLVTNPISSALSGNSGTVIHS